VKFLLDTNVIAELRKGVRANAHVLAWFEALEPDSILLSVLTLGEIRKGIENVRRKDPRTARALERWLRQLVTDHGDRIVPVDRTIAEEWGRLNVPDPLPVIDGLLAATAKTQGLTLVTRNVKDVARTGVLLLNPFKAPSVS
jgi:predicted nucleic acid-binding protein